MPLVHGVPRETAHALCHNEVNFASAAGFAAVPCTHLRRHAVNLSRLCDLPRRQLREEAVSLHQLVIRPVLGNLAALRDKDAVGVQ